MNAFTELRKKIIKAISLSKGDLDYSFIESGKAFWEQLAQASNSAVIVMDIYENMPLYVSDTLFSSFSLESSTLKENITNLINYIHPADFNVLAEQKFNNFCFLLNLPAGEKLDYKYIYQYRVKASEDNYLWVIEQQQVLRLDNNGNVRITLSIIDISPNQSKENQVENYIFNYKTGKTILPTKSDIDISQNVFLTERETEILSLIQTGLLSKEISEKLSISFNTVNTHRQNILKKLNANNSLEAISYAKELGLI